MSDLQVLLLELGKQPHTSTLHRLYEATKLRLFGVSLRILGNQELAEDCLQESFIKIWQKAASFDPDKSQAITWMSRIVRNQAIDMLRRNNNKLVYTDTLPEELDERDDQITQLQQVEANALLHDCLSQLKPEQVHCIMASYFQGQTAKHIADKLGRPVSTVKTWMARSLPLLRRCLEKCYDTF